MLAVLMIPLSKLYVCYVCKIFDSKDLITLEEDNSKYQTLVDSVENDDSPHLGSNDVLFSRVGHSLQQLIGGRLGGQGKGSKGIHDQVDPQHLDRSERRSLQDN